MPPVTVRPLKGSRLQIFWIYCGIFSSSVVMVALSQLLRSGSEQNFSGCPNAGSCAAIFFHRSQPLPGRMVGSKPAALFCAPMVQLSTQPPLVMKSRSFSVRPMVVTSPLWSTVTPTACFLPGSRLNWTSTTLVS